MATSYKITTADKDKIQPHLPAGAPLLAERNGVWYIEDSEIAPTNAAHGGLLDLIATTEALAVDWNTYIGTLEVFNFDSVASAAADGFEEYRSIINSVNNVGGLSQDLTKLDTDIAIYTGWDGVITDMVVPVFALRAMLKDGFFEWAVRCVEHYMDPAATGLAAIKAASIAEIRDLAKDHGRTDADLDYAQNSAKGTLV